MINKGLNPTRGDIDRKTALEHIAVRLAHWTEKTESSVTPIPGLALFRHDDPTEPVSAMHQPSLCLVIRGTKRVLLGSDAYVYDPNHYPVAPVHLPAVVQVITASRQYPYLGLMRKPDQREMSPLWWTAIRPRRGGGNPVDVGSASPDKSC